MAHLDVHDSGEGTPVVLLHGLTATHRVVVMGSKALEPGVAALTPDAVPHWRFIWPIVRWIQRRASAEAAAAAPLLLASSPALAHVSGRYYNGVKEKRLPGRVTDATTQDRTWALGESLVARVLGADGRTA